MAHSKTYRGRFLCPEKNEEKQLAGSTREFQPTFQIGRMILQRSIIDFSGGAQKRRSEFADEVPRGCTASDGYICIAKSIEAGLNNASIRPRSSHA
jgi:hypothetical protein